MIPCFLSFFSVLDELFLISSLDLHCYKKERTNSGHFHLEWSWDAATVFGMASHHSESASELNTSDASELSIGADLNTSETW